MFRDIITFVLGTRPEIVKIAPVARRFADETRVIHTGQHYDDALSAVFFAECAMRRPDVTLDVGGCSRAAQVGQAVLALDRLLGGADRPAAIVVQGDTNAALAGALAANTLEIPLVHLEAGLRSFDRRMPEEHNRVLIDHIADLLCAPTIGNVGNLLAESIPVERIELTGNTVVQALTDRLPDPPQRAKVLADVGVQPGAYVLVTIHRPENTDHPHTLTTIIEQLTRVAAAGHAVIFPMHPRTRAAIHRYGLADYLTSLIACEPLGYNDFLALAADAALLVSDSGGVQEEATVLRRPLLVVRRSTERPEAMERVAELVPPGPALSKRALGILADVQSVHARLAALPCPFGDLNTATRTEAAIRTLLAGPSPRP